MNRVRAIVVAVGFIEYVLIGIIGYAPERLKHSSQEVELGGTQYILPFINSATNKCGVQCTPRYRSSHENRQTKCSFLRSWQRIQYPRTGPC